MREVREAAQLGVHFFVAAALRCVSFLPPLRTCSEVLFGTPKQAQKQIDFITCFMAVSPPVPRVGVGWPVQPPAGSGPVSRPARAWPVQLPSLGRFSRQQGQGRFSRPAGSAAQNLTRFRQNPNRGLRPFITRPLLGPQAVLLMRTCCCLLFLVFFVGARCSLCQPLRMCAPLSPSQQLPARTPSHPPANSGRGVWSRNRSK